jgi:hypothetical protein
MATTASEPPGSVKQHRAYGVAERYEAGWIASSVRTDPVRSVAAVLIVISLVVRAQIASRGYLAIDDFALTSRAAGSELTADFLLGLFNNHFMPAAMLITWLVTRSTGLAFWPYVVLLTVGQAVLSVAFYRLLRRLMRPGWGVLVPLCIFLFSPLSLEVTSWWAVGVNMLPMELAMVLAIGAQVKYVRTRRKRHLVTLALSLLFGLLFFEKSLLIVPLVFAVTACLFVTGGPFRSVTRTVARFWPSWLVLTLLSVAYVGLYMSRAGSSLRAPQSAGEVMIFLRQLIGSTVIPGLVGGPWRWLDAGDGAPVTAPAEFAKWLAWAAFAALVVVTVWLRRSAVRAWVLLGAYLSMVAGLLAATRLGSVFSGVAGGVPRYVTEVVIVAALCMGVALFGQLDPAEEEPERPGTLRAEVRNRHVLAAALVVALTAFGLGAAWTAARFGDDWAVKQGRDYLHTAQAELAAAPPGTVFLDGPVPPGVVGPLSQPYNLQSNFFRPVKAGPIFVTEAENLSMFDDSGRIRPVEVDGWAVKPGPEGGCGYKLAGGQTVGMPLADSAYRWFWMVRVAYLSSGDSTAVFELGSSTRRFAVQRGLHQFFFPVEAGGDMVRLTVTDPTVTLCTNEITIGTARPRQ